MQNQPLFETHPIASWTIFVLVSILWIYFVITRIAPLIPEKTKMTKLEAWYRRKFFFTLKYFGPPEIGLGETDTFLSPAKGYQHIYVGNGRLWIKKIPNTNIECIEDEFSETDKWFSDFLKYKRQDNTGNQSTGTE